MLLSMLDLPEPNPTKALLGRWDAMAHFETWCGFDPPNLNCYPDMDEELSAASSSTMLTKQLSSYFSRRTSGFS